MPNIRILRDVAVRKGVKAHEVARRAYLACARNQALEPAVRYQAQLQLNNFGRYTRPTVVRNRCTVSGKGRGVIGEFGLSRYQFRLAALAGQLPGVQKASW
ncbi:glucocorticoid receptor-like (DNA-binding domain) [Calocera cornea HHB12733]|uniref:Glucocorticoid receptor-like (DNA-binding domain) n=1 Tax=Calocera cornea HHB12733 TaxID=1353952 RepID=A0A165JX35_9BASI|nr:glucocorticoid receptor-like (DNA-binding domain) [Calocera cornea HHB12733]